MRKAGGRSTPAEGPSAPCRGTLVLWPHPPLARPLPRVLRRAKWALAPPARKGKRAPSPASLCGQQQAPRTGTHAHEPKSAAPHPPTPLLPPQGTPQPAPDRPRLSAFCTPRVACARPAHRAERTRTRTPRTSGTAAQLPHRPRPTGALAVPATFWRSAARPLPRHTRFPARTPPQVPRCSGKVARGPVPRASSPGTSRRGPSHGGWHASCVDRTAHRRFRAHAHKCRVCCAAR